MQAVMKSGQPRTLKPAANHSSPSTKIQSRHSCERGSAAARAARSTRAAASSAALAGGIRGVVVTGLTLAGPCSKGQEQTGKSTNFAADFLLPLLTSYF